MSHVNRTVRVNEYTFTHSVVEGEERSVAILPCLLSCCSLGEEGRESVISSISSWADCDLVFFLLNACLKELRNCNTHNTNTQGQKHQHTSSVISCQFILTLMILHPVRKLLRAVSKQWALSGLGKKARSKTISTDENGGAGVFNVPKNFGMNRQSK